MITLSSFRKCGFTLIETVIAIGVLAVLLTGFIIVFAPAAAGIKKSINLQAADRLASTLEQELVTLRTGQESTDITTGFDKAFDWIKNSNVETNTDNALLVYQYRGSLTERRADDNTPMPVAKVTNQVAGKDYIVQSMVRRKSDKKFLDDDEKTFLDDLPAVEGGVYLVKCTQLVFDPTSGALIAGTPGLIKNPKPNSTPPDPNYQTGPFDKADAYPEAVIAFTAEFYSLSGKSESYFGTPFGKAYTAAKNPIFTRNLAVRR